MSRMEIVSITTHLSKFDYTFFVVKPEEASDGCDEYLIFVHLRKVRKGKEGEDKWVVQD